MKTINVPFKIAEANKFGEAQYLIDVINWKEYPYKPHVSFQISYDDEHLYLHYEVEEDCVRARAAQNNGQVWLDSCVEFFLSPEGNDDYYNLECNCIGTKLLGFHESGAQSEHASDKIIDNIQVYSSLGNDAFEEKVGNISWYLEAKIPWSSFWRHQISELKGKSMKANFYKCGDELSKPHYLSWNPIDTEQPSFHQPKFFGELKF